VGGLVFLLATACIFLVIVEVYAVMHRAMAQYRKRYVGARVEELGSMFIFIDPGQLALMNLSLVAVFLGIGLIFLDPVSTTILVAFGFASPWLIVRHYRKRRVRRFEVQLVDALSAMANAFKAGLTMPQAMEQIARDGMPPISQEFGLVVNELKLGVPLEEALDKLAQRIDSEDLRLLVTSTNVARGLGGNMSEMFETIANTIRERFRLEGKIKSMTSQGRLQGWIVASLPIVLGLVLNYMRPDLMQPMLKHWFGWALVAAIAVMETLGVLIIRRIVNINV
jgi:tight adherence protein B